MQSFKTEWENFLESIQKASKASEIDLLRIDDDTFAMVGLNSIEILTDSQRELIELIIDNPSTGAQLAKKVNKSPQFISKTMKPLKNCGIVDHIKAPFGPSKFYTLRANVLGKEEMGQMKEETIPSELKSEIESRGVLGNLMSLSFKEILDMIKELDENEKRKVLDFIMEYCQVEEA